MRSAGRSAKQVLGLWGLVAAACALATVVGYVAGITAPVGRRMGHAGAIISAFGDSAADKAAIMRECGITVAPSPAALGSTMAALLAEHGLAAALGARAAAPVGA